MELGQWCIRRVDDDWMSAPGYATREEAIQRAPAELALLPGEKFAVAVHEQDYETARAGIDCTDPYACASAFGALYRLKEEAAKVPGLEAQSEADRYAIHGALSWSGHWKVGYDQKPSRHVAALLERLAKAESERDAAAIRHAEHTDTWARALETAVAERDAARQERDKATSLAAQSASDHTQTLDRMEGMATERTALRERVTTLEREVARAAEYAAGRDVIVEAWSDALGLQRTDGYDAAEAIRTSRDAAEARVKELERERDEAVREALRRLASRLGDDATGFNKTLDAEGLAVAIFQFTQEREQVARDAAWEEAANLLDNVDSANPASLIRSLASQPPPAMAQGVDREHLGQEVRAEWVAWAREQPNPKPSWLVPWEGLSEPDREVDRRIGERLFLLGQRATPTPPALVEAVGPFAAVGRMLLRHQPPLSSRIQGEVFRAEWHGDSVGVTALDFERLSAAYDAAKGGGK